MSDSDVTNLVTSVRCCAAETAAKDSSTSAAVDGARTGSRADEAGRRGGWRRRDDGVAGGEDQAVSDADTVEDSVLGDGDEKGRGGVGRHRASRGQRHGHQRPGRGHRARRTPPNTSSYRIFIALFDYHPATMSPNRDAIDEELAFYEGQLLKVIASRLPSLAGASKGPSATQNASRKSSGRGVKNKEVKGGQSVPFLF